MTSCRVDIRPLSDRELREVICQPAAQVGLKVSTELQERIINEVKAAPGSLPLLEYALTELWQAWHREYQEDKTIAPELTIEHYRAVGGVEGALEKQANQVYQQFSGDAKKQGLVERIFVELVQPGVDTEDTRKRVWKRELVSDIHPEVLVDQVLAVLVQSRLVVRDAAKVGTEEQVETVIDLAHEALIRHWSKLQNWLEKHRQYLPVIRQLRREARRYAAEQGNKSKHFLRGVKLEEAQDCLIKYGNLGYFDAQTQEFISLSKKTWIEEETEKEKQILEALYMTAEFQWSQGNRQGSLISITKAGARVQQLRDSRPEVKPVNCQKVVEKLQETLYDRIQDSSLLTTLTGHSGWVNAIAYSPDGATLASASDDKTVKLWNVQDGSLLTTLTGHSGWVNAIAYSPDGATLASASSDTTVKLWNAQNSSLLATLTGHRSLVNAIAYSPDGATLASASSDTTVKLWNAQNSSLLTTLPDHGDGVNAIAYSPDGAILASAISYKAVKLWNAQDGSLLATLTDHGGSVNAIAYSPDGTTLASASDDSTVKLWNAQDGSLLATLTGHGGSVNAIAYSPDGATLASASDDKTVKLWDVKLKFDLNLDSAMAYAHDWLRGYLTHNPNVSASDKKLLEI
ncbi:MAG: WD40 repeat domain-containing protein [Symploca sp. SIO1A3]|nr:WD40 repeat domain-containing protein [Symploca sp. SIO1A3]